MTSLAMKYLEAPHSLPNAEGLDGWMFRLRLWHYPAFGKSTTWAIYEARRHGPRKKRMLLRKVVWDRPTDASRLSDPLVGLKLGFHVEPTVEVQDRPIDDAEVENRLRILGELAFPGFLGEGIGIDGETFGIALPMHWQEIEWWGDGPSEWGELIAWAARFREWLNEVAELPASQEPWKMPRPRLL